MGGGAQEVVRFWCMVLGAKQNAVLLVSIAAFQAELASCFNCMFAE